MQMTDATTLPFPPTLKFPDVDPATLEDEDDREMDFLTQQGPWQTYMLRVLEGDPCR